MAAESTIYASQLRLELCLRNRAYCKALSHVESYGSMPVIVYEPSPDGSRHGNFSDRAYDAIRSRPEWFRRFAKVHAQAKRALPKSQRGWRELDSSMSSDALLMNVFCYPGVCDDARVADMLGVEKGLIPEFGFRAKVPLASGGVDRTEVDMRLGTLLVESKLTEGDFQSKSAEVVEAYRDFEEVFDHRQLPHTDDVYASYQLIRNVLAAHALECSFCVLHDARRPDLREAWFAVMSAVKSGDLRRRCKVLTWKELSAALPSDLQAFLDVKYGITPPGVSPSAVPGWPLD
ncbi:MAG TPA: hypothetical protein VMU24_12725 [Candidatus Acidoferrales bacterium]|nr:hypothetical protein [Candidatus Acidoferrales bacterium]